VLRIRNRGRGSENESECQLILPGVIGFDWFIRRKKSSI